MSRKIILIGGLLDQVSKDAFVARLKSDVSATDEWAWIDTSADELYQPPHPVMNRLIDELRKWLAAKKRAESSGDVPDPESLVVIKLVHLHGRAANQLFSVWRDPKLVSHNATTSDELVAWLLSPDSDLFPPVEWWAGVTEAALVAILCKLLSKKRWGSGVKGHHFLKEEDLLTQSPVARDDRPAVQIEATRLLSTLEGRLLLKKGSAGGNTPTEWSIDTRFLTEVKQAMLAKSLAPLRVFPVVSGLLDRIAAEQPKEYRLDVEIVNEKVAFVCRERS